MELSRAHHHERMCSTAHDVEVKVVEVLTSLARLEKL